MSWKFIEILQVLYTMMGILFILSLERKYLAVANENDELRESIKDIKDKIKKYASKPPVSVYVDASKPGTVSIPSGKYTPKNTVLEKKKYRSNTSSQKVVSFNSKKLIDDLEENLDHYRVKYNLHKTLCDDIRKGKVYDVTEKELLDLNEAYRVAAKAKAEYAIDELKKKQDLKMAVGEYKSRYDANRRMFTDSQSLVNYVADENNPQRLLYDKSSNKVKTVKSFDVINNSLCIFFAGHSGYETFIPNKYGEHGVIQYI